MGERDAEEDRRRGRGEREDAPERQRPGALLRRPDGVLRVGEEGHRLPAAGGAADEVAFDGLVDDGREPLLGEAGDDGGIGAGAGVRAGEPGECAVSHG